MAKGERVLLTEQGVRLTLTRSEALELYRTLGGLVKSDQNMRVMSALNVGLYPTIKENNNDT